MFFIFFYFSDKDYRLVQDIMVQFNLTKMSDRLVSQLSGGEHHHCNHVPENDLNGTGKV